MYIKHKIYHMTYNKVQNRLNDYQFIEVDMSKWYDYITFSEILGSRVY